MVIFCKKGVLTKLSKFTIKCFCWILAFNELQIYSMQLYQKRTPAKVISWKPFSQNTFSIEAHRTIASA